MRVAVNNVSGCAGIAVDVETSCCISSVGAGWQAASNSPTINSMGKMYLKWYCFSCLFFLFIFALYFQLAKPSYFDKRFPAIQALGLAGLDGKDPTNRINITVNI